MSAFRDRICEKMGIVPFPHQAAWWAASDGLQLVPSLAEEGEPGMLIQRPLNPEDPSKDIVQERWKVVPRKKGEREVGRAKVLSLLGAFKTGKSFGAGIWLASFAAVPGARISLVGSEYDVTSPEFEYVLEALLSEKGMNMKADSWVNRPRDGKMWIDLPNGVRYETRSWERRESLKGKENDCYCFCEAYQLPGIECFTSISQNLRVRDGYALFPTTPDRPWVKELRDKSLSTDPDFDKWFCESDVDASNNPYSYDPSARRRDAQLMTQEKYLIHYEGKVGDFVGSVFSFQKGQRQFNAHTHPFLFKGGEHFQNLVVPDGWEVVSAVDTGTFYSALWCAFSPEGEAFVLAEAPNYRYVGGKPERKEEVTIPSWVSGLKVIQARLGAKSAYWADRNSQFKTELSKYGIALMPNFVPFETRTEIAREYFQHNKIWLAPWLEVLPHELENAEWPPEVNATGKFTRLKKDDHTLDELEHILSKRPRGSSSSSEKKGSWLYNFIGSAPRKKTGNVHLGAS